MKTFTFKIYTYENSLGETVIRAKWVNRFWFDSWVKIAQLNEWTRINRWIGCRDGAAEWNDRATVINDLRAMCLAILRASNALASAEKRRQLRLITIDQIEVDLSKET